MQTVLVRDPLALPWTTQGVRLGTAISRHNTCSDRVPQQCPVRYSGNECSVQGQPRAETNRAYARHPSVSPTATPSLKAVVACLPNGGLKHCTALATKNADQNVVRRLPQTIPTNRHQQPLHASIMHHACLLGHLERVRLQPPTENVCKSCGRYLGLACSPRRSAAKYL